MQLLLLPKEDPDRSIWWENMGHDRDSLPPPKTARCCTRHMDTKVARRFWRPVPGMLNVITRSAVSRDAVSVAQRRAEYEETRRKERAKALEKQTVKEMMENSEKMAQELLQTRDRLNDTNKELRLCHQRLEKMAPSKLSTLDDAWVSAFTPFRSKVCLVGFLMTMVLPNMKHAWGFAGFKDKHDALRRKAEDTIEDGSRASDCYRVANVQLEKERQRIHQVRI